MLQADEAESKPVTEAVKEKVAVSEPKEKNVEKVKERDQKEKEKAVVEKKKPENKAEVATKERMTREKEKVKEKEEKTKSPSKSTKREEGKNKEVKDGKEKDSKDKEIKEKEGKEKEGKEQKEERKHKRPIEDFTRSDTERKNSHSSLVLKKFTSTDSTPESKSRELVGRSSSKKEKILKRNSQPPIKKPSKEKVMTERC